MNLNLSADIQLLAASSWWNLISSVQLSLRYIIPSVLMIVKSEAIAIIIIIIIIKTSRTGPSWENKIVYKLLTKPHKHLRHTN